MPVIEDILEAVSPLDGLFMETFVTFNIAENSSDVVRIPTTGGPFKLLFHSDNNKNVKVYFIMSPFSLSLFFTKGKEELKKKHENHEMIVFSAENLFNFLDIPYTNPYEGYLNDLRTLSNLIKDNSGRIFQALSDEYLERTYNCLINLNGNDVKKITTVLAPTLAFNN